MDAEGLERVPTDRVKDGQRDRWTVHVRNGEGLERIQTDRVKDGQRDRWKVHVRMERAQKGYIQAE